MSDSEAIEAINKALENELDGVDFEAIAEYKLRNLDKDYAKTIAAVVNEEPVSNFNDPGWEADFSGQGYEQCPSDEEEITDEIPKTQIRDIELTDESIGKIKEIMARIKIKPPHWAKNIPEEVFAQHLKLKTFN